MPAAYDGRSGVEADVLSSAVAGRSAQKHGSGPRTNGGSANPRVEVEANGSWSNSAATRS